MDLSFPDSIMSLPGTERLDHPDGFMGYAISVDDIISRNGRVPGVGTVGVNYMAPVLTVVDDHPWDEGDCVTCTPYPDGRIGHSFDAMRWAHGHPALRFNRPDYWNGDT